MVDLNHQRKIQRMKFDVTADNHTRGVIHFITDSAFKIKQSSDNNIEHTAKKLMFDDQNFLIACD